MDLLLRPVIARRAAGVGAAPAAALPLDLVPVQHERPLEPRILPLVDLGFGRIVGSEIEAPIILVNLV